MKKSDPLGRRVRFGNENLAKVEEKRSPYSKHPKYLSLDKRVFKCYLALRKNTLILVGD